MKRNISLFALTIGVIMMWVHATVPHHHHKGEVCFVKRVKASCCQAGHHHEKNQHGHSTTCNLLNDLAQAEKFKYPISIQAVKTIHSAVSTLIYTNWTGQNLKLWVSKYTFYLNIFKRLQLPIPCSFSFRAPPL